MADPSKKRPKKKLSKKEVQSLLPIIKEFNGVAKHLIGLLGAKVQQKESNINVMVSKIGVPIREEHQVKVLSVDMSKNFLNKMRKRKKEDGDSDFDENFGQKKGFII